MTRKLAALAALAGALAAAAALAGSAQAPGVTADSILIGGTAPISGEASSAAAVARGAEAYLEYVNDRGGVHGRKILYRYLDDAYDPARTVQAVRQLVEQDGVFAVFNTLGTSNNLAVRDYLNQSRVPHLFVASGANTWGADFRRYPWTIGYIPSYVLEGRVYGRYVLRTLPGARIAVLYQDDDYGRDLIRGLRLGLGAKAQSMIRALAGYDPTAPDVSSQVAQLKASKADVLMIFAFGKFAIQAQIQAAKLGWRPKLVVINAVASSASLMQLAELAGGKPLAEGAVSIVFFKDPSDPRWAKDPGLALERQILRRYLPGANPKDGYYVAGMASAYTLVNVLRKAGPQPTREGVMRAARSLDERGNPFVIPGIVIRTGPKDGFPMQQVALQRWTKGHWSIFTGLLTAGS